MGNFDFNAMSVWDKICSILKCIKSLLFQSGRFSWYSTVLKFLLPTVREKRFLCDQRKINMAYFISLCLACGLSTLEYEMISVI